MTDAQKAAAIEVAVAAALETLLYSLPRDWPRLAVPLLSAQNALAAQYRPLAHRVAIAIGKKFPLIDRDELASECMVGIVKASRDWRPGRGNAALTHLWNGAYFAGRSWAAKANHAGFTGLSNRPTVRPGVVETVTSPDGVAVPLVEMLTVEDAEGPALAADEWRTLFDGMPERLRDTLRMRYAEGMTLEAAGNVLGVSKERTRQLQVEAVAWLWDHKTEFMAEVVL